MPSLTPLPSLPLFASPSLSLHSIQYDVNEGLFADAAVIVRDYLAAVWFPPFQNTSDYREWLG